MKEFESLPFFSRLTDQERNIVNTKTQISITPSGTEIFDSTSCKGLLFVLSGTVRVYILSSEGREITLYRLFKNDICTLSVSCLMGSMPMQAIVKTDTDCTLGFLSNDIFSQIHAGNTDIQRFILENMNARMNDVLWVLEQVAFRAMDRRVAEFLLSQPALIIYATHEVIAAELGTAREVVSRMLKYFEKNELIQLYRGKIRIIDGERLKKFTGIDDAR